MKTTAQLGDETRRHSTEVHRSEAHKVHGGHLWVNSAEQLGDGLRVGFEIPAFEAVPRFAELMEVQRQSGLVHAHRQLLVPPTDVFVLNAIALFLAENPGRRDSAGSMAVWSDNAAALPRVRSAVQRFSLNTQSGMSGTGSSDVSFVPASVYERLRRTAVSRPYASATPGSESVDVLTLPTIAGDPLTSDHSSDHVSAMAIVAGIERLFSDGPDHLSLTGLSLRFISYAHALGVPLLFHLEWEEGTRFTGRVTQGETLTAVVDGIVAVAPRTKAAS